MNSCIHCELKSDAARKLNSKELELLNAKCGQRHFESKQDLFLEGEECKYIVFLRSGLVKIHINSGNENDYIYRIVKAPGYIGLANLFSDKPNAVSATCMTHCDVCLIPKEVFLGFIRTNHEFALQIIRQISRDKLDFYEHISEQQQKLLNGKLAAALIYLADHIFGSTSFTLPLTRTELAQYVGSTRESLTRALSDFDKSGIISVHLKNIRILDMDRLEAIRGNG